MRASYSIKLADGKSWKETVREIASNHYHDDYKTSLVVVSFEEHFREGHSEEASALQACIYWGIVDCVVDDEDEA